MQRFHWILSASHRFRFRFSQCQGSAVFGEIDVAALAASMN